MPLATSASSKLIRILQTQRTSKTRPTLVPLATTVRKEPRSQSSAHPPHSPSSWPLSKRVNARFAKWDSTVHLMKTCPSSVLKAPIVVSPLSSQRIAQLAPTSLSLRWGTCWTVCPALLVTTATRLASETWSRKVTNTSAPREVSAQAATISLPSPALLALISTESRPQPSPSASNKSSLGLKSWLTISKIAASVPEATLAQQALDSGTATHAHLAPSAQPVQVSDNFARQAGSARVKVTVKLSLPSVLKAFIAPLALKFPCFVALKRYVLGSRPARPLVERPLRTASQAPTSTLIGAFLVSQALSATGKPLRNIQSIS